METKIKEIKLQGINLKELEVKKYHKLTVDIESNERDELVNNTKNKGSNKER